MTVKTKYVKSLSEASTGQPAYTIYNSSGEEVGTANSLPEGVTTGAPVYRSSDGSLSLAPKMNISINDKTGNIKIAGPKSITSTEQFKTFIDEDQLKQYSQAYKTNKDFKLQVTEKNERTGEDETKEITLPEYIERINSSLANYAENLMEQKKYTNFLVQAYGDKAKNMTQGQIVMSAQGAKSADATYLPDSILNVESFGNGIVNPFRKVSRGDSDEVSAESLKEVWTRENFGREEIATLLAHINGRLDSMDFSAETYYRDADGNLVYNRNSAEEAAKLIAFKNYVLNNNPDAEWYQQAGGWIESAALNFTSAVTNVFANLAVIGEGAIDILPGVEAKSIINWKNEADSTMATYNAMNAQAWDAIVNAQIWGYLAGTATGTIALNALGKAILRGVGETAAATTVHLRNIGIEMAEELGLTGAAASALTPQTMLFLEQGAGAASLGTRLWISSLTNANKALIATNAAISAINGTKDMSILVEYLFDTIHDAILYDGATLRNVIDAVRRDGSDENKQEVLNYWLGQFAENAKFWAPLGIARGTIKLAGKTAFGKAANVVVTRFVNKVAANVGLRKQGWKDKLANGSVVKKLEDDIEDAVSNNKFTKANRLQRKLDIENWNEEVRKARQRLGALELEWDGGRLTEKTLKQYQDLVSDVKILENGIDAYNRNILNKIDEMTVKQIDPSTGKHMFLNPELGGENAKTTMYYWDLVDLNKKYGLSVAKDSMLNQDVVDYWVNSYYKGLADSFATSDGVNAAKAQEASETLQKNIDALSKTVPQEIQDYIDNMLARKIYQNWYYAQNEYGMFKGLLNRDRITSYQNNPIWQENGYMPIRVQQNTSGYWVDADGRIDAVIEQDFDTLTFNVAEGQHYVDPEMVRQSRLRKLAQAEVSKELFKAYNGFSDNATNVVQITGEQTAHVDKAERNRASLEKAVSDNASAAFEENFVVGAQITKSHKPVKNEIIAEDTRSAIVSSMSPRETANYLSSKQGKRVLRSPSAKMTDGVTIENYSDWYNEKLNDSARKYLAQQYGMATSPATGSDGFLALQKAIANGGDSFEAGLQRSYLIGDKAFAKSSIMNEAARNLADGKDAFYQGVILAKIKGETRNILKLDVGSFWDDMSTTIRGQVDDYVAMVKSNPGAKAAMDTLSETVNGSEDVANYIALRQLKETNLQAAYDALDEQIEGLSGISKLSHENVELLKKKAHELLDDTIDSELDFATNATKIINPDLVDSKDIYAKVDSLAKEIEGAEANLKDSSTGYIMYLNDEGQQVYAQVDPAFASLFNTRARITKTEASVMAKINSYTSRVFRYGTTSLNLSAFGNQMFRDFGNAILVGGAWQTIKSNADNLKDVFGERIVEQIKTFDPDDYEMRQISRIAEETGQSINEAAVSRELMRGSAIAGTTTETSLYRDFMKQAYGDDTDNLLNNAKGKLQELWEKYDPDKYMNGKRENYLRNRVYASSLNDAMEQGYSLSQARVYAEFAMNNATTNFARQLYHMQAIADSTPYFRAAINGTKSFWRMWSLDPVGISGRIMGGLILPVMFLTGASLGSERDRKVYQNIPEYQKKDSLVFVLNGEAVSIPLPQELSPIVAPFRQFVEYLHDTNQNDFWELMSNDLLGFSPYDLTGFTAIDYDKMIEDPAFFDRVGRGFARLFSQMAPVPLKSAYMIASGTDPYTGKWLRDPSYAYWNDETNSIEIMDEYQSDFANWFAKMFPGTNPAIADKVISGVLGSTGSNLLSDFTALLAEGPEVFAKKAGEHLFEQASNPITVGQYDLVDAIWKRAVRQLTGEKDALLSSKEMKELNSELSQTKDPEKRQKLLAERQNLTDAYKERVAQMVERLEAVYHGNFDRKKFAAVVALLNFNSDAAYQSGSQYSSNLASEMYWNGRDEAIHTMERMGITGTSDMSIFGYLATTRDGEVVMKYSSPTAIMDMSAQWQNQDDINAANIKALLSTNNMYDAHKAISDQISKIYGSKKKLSNQDKANIEAIQINWNAQLAKIIAPYITQMTPEAALNNNEVLNLLYPYVEVPSSWETNDKGKSVYLGSKGNKKRAYYESWIKSMFSVNDPYKGQY